MRFWNMSYGEILAAINGYQERQKYDMQMQAVMGYRQAQLIGSLVSKLMGGKHKAPTLQDAYPGVFPEEVLQRKQQDWRVMKERIAAHGDQYKRKRGERRDAGGTTDTDHGRNWPTT
ncbi:hypothetical protein [Paenibacillus paeoniae]|uniref:hypothetical protein n=1 Tax=Paenibacillus paeoniae TaxID=2292705 RepID=UPI00105919B9|nr:hypothetical protein [Paenibacillus paeoniae]